MLSEPTNDDIKLLAEQWLLASQLAHAATGRKLDESMADLDSLQEVLDRNLLSPSDTYALQCLGVAFGRILASNVPGLDWAIADDEYGRDPTLRFERTSIQINCVTMISKRVEDAQPIDLRELFEGAVQALAEVRAELEAASN